MTLTVGSLFSGIGGLDLGLERAGMEVIWQSEIDPYACKVLSKHWPEVVNHGDIKKINWQEVERPDVICGGYPCQPFSTAGKRRGEEDPRHLWPWVREAISELRPRYAILENVRGHLSMGGLSVIGELATIGYDAEWRIVSAASVGANHRRDRIIIVAYPNNSRPHRAQIDTTKTGFDALGGVGGRSTNVANTDSERCGKWGLNNSACVNICSCKESRNVANPDNSGDRASRCDTNGDGQTLKQRRQDFSQSWPSGCSADVADTNSEQLNERGHRNSETTTRKRQTLQSSVNRSSSTIPNSDTWENGGRDRGFQQSARTVFAGADNGRGTEIYAGWQWWETEPDVGRVAHGIPSRVDRLRGLGNAVVPQVAEVIGRLVVEHANIHAQ